MDEAPKTQLLAAAERFERAQTPPAAPKAAAAEAVILQVEPTARSEVRRALIHPRDGLALERIIGLSDLIMINYLEFGLRTAKAVCCIHIRQRNGRTVGFGTGFMVSPTLLLTNSSAAVATIW